MKAPSAQVALDKADSLRSSNQHLSACRWYLTAADAWAAEGKPQRAALAMIEASGAAVAMKQPADALEMLADAEKLIGRIAYPTALHAELAEGRARANLAVRRVAPAAAQWDLAIITRVRLYDASGALALVETAERTMSEARAALPPVTQQAAIALRGALGEGPTTGPLHDTIVDILRDDSLAIPHALTPHTALFDQARENLSDAVGATISAKLSDKQLAEFEALVDAGADDEASQWLATQVPDAPQIARASVREHVACLEVLISRSPGET